VQMSKVSALDGAPGEAHRLSPHELIHNKSKDKSNID
jgi:hypothetical protein